MTMRIQLTISSMLFVVFQEVIAYYCGNSSKEKVDFEEQCEILLQIGH